MRCCKGRVGPGALVVKLGGNWAARSCRKLCFIAMESAQLARSCKLWLPSHLCSFCGLTFALRARAALDILRAFILLRISCPKSGQTALVLSSFFIFQKI